MEQHANQSSNGGEPVESIAGGNLAAIAPKRPARESQRSQDVNRPEGCAQPAPLDHGFEIIIVRMHPDTRDFAADFAREIGKGSLKSAGTKSTRARGRNHAQANLRCQQPRFACAWFLVEFPPPPQAGVQSAESGEPGQRS